MADRALTGVLLVGGASTRFGSPKALAEVDGRTLAEIGWDALAFCDERLAVGKVADGLKLPFEILDDGTDIRAPIAGVIAGLRAASHELCLMLPVDMPHLGREQLEQLASTDADVAAPPTGPLPGAYRRTALPVLERNLAMGRLALWEALGELEAVTVRLPPASLANVNTPNDLARS